VDGPAIEYREKLKPSNALYVTDTTDTDVEIDPEDGNRIVKGWYFEGRPHRLYGGPAILRANGTREWWVHGKMKKSENFSSSESESDCISSGVESE